MYDFVGTESGVGTWRDMTAGATGTYSSGNKKIIPFKSNRLQNSIAAYDKYIFIFSINYHTANGNYAPFNGIYYMNAETEEWFLGGMAEPSKFSFIYVSTNSDHFIYII